MTATRVAGTVLVVIAGLSMMAGCSREKPSDLSLVGPDSAALSKTTTEPVDRGTPRRVSLAGPETILSRLYDDEDFLDELAAGTFTVCKVADGSTTQFTFMTTAVGPGVETAPVYEPEVTLGDGECADVYVAPLGTGVGPDDVTITEMVPEGWQVDRVAIWSLDLLGDTPDTTFHELPAGTTEVEGSIDAEKLGCVVIFYNSEVPVECTGEIGDFVWNDSGGTKGIQDEGEEGLEGVRVVLKDGNGDILDETQTDENGYYLFSGLCAGDYMVMVDESTVPEGWMQTPTEVGDDRCIDNNPNPSMVTLTVDDSSDLCVDFGYMEPVMGPGVGSPGYWHKPSRWPVDSIEVGGVTYTKEEAASYMTGGQEGDKTITMFRQVVAAKLNVMIGNDDSCIADTLEDADNWMADYPLGSGVEASSEAWTEGEPLKNALDDYNNGRLCAPYRD
jgi:hypothetical protein